MDRRCLKSGSSAEEVLRDRLWWLGRALVNGCMAETFLARGAHWTGAKNTFAKCERLNECISPLVFVPDRTGQRGLFGEHTTVASLVRVARLERNLALDASAIAFGDCLHPRDVDTVFRHSPDFRSVFLRGKEFGLTTNQAQVVQCLHNARVNDTPDVSQGYLLTDVLETSQERLRDIFRDLAGWDSLIVPGKTKGTFRLNF